MDDKNLQNTLLLMLQN